MLLSLLLPLFYLFLLAQAGRKKKPRQSTSAISTADSPLLTSSSDPPIPGLPGPPSPIPLSADGPSPFLNYPDPSSDDDLAGPSDPDRFQQALDEADHFIDIVAGADAAGPSDLGTLEQVIDQTVTFIDSATGASVAGPVEAFGDEATNFAVSPSDPEGVICRTASRFPLLNRQECISSAMQIHTPAKRGGGIDIPPTAPASAFRFGDNHGHCEFFITATHAYSEYMDGKPMLWEPNDIEWIQIWIHIRMKAEQLIHYCSADQGASAEELSRVHGGRGGASAIVVNGQRLSDRMFQWNSLEKPRATIRFEILLHDGRALAERRRQGRTSEG
ncbi:hypothetical protein MMC13_004374 [Lambiella insularis]|nr:hypothetical protein [Lambiella insularis]